MADYCLVLSKKKEDEDLAAYVAVQNNLELILAKTAQDVKLEHFTPASLAFWDVEGKSALIIAAESNALKSGLKPQRIFALADQNLMDLDSLKRINAYGHFIRRSGSTVSERINRSLIALLGAAAVKSSPFGLNRYMPKGSDFREIVIKDSSQRGVATNAVENILHKKEIADRLGTLVAQAVDEMLMNAIFDAPVTPEGTQYRRNVERDSDFDFTEKEFVTMTIGQCDNYLAISVVDNFGSLERDATMGFQHKDYSKEKYLLHRSPSRKGASLGIYGIVNSGLSLLFICKKGAKTEVILFFPKTKSFKNFRMGQSYLGFLN